VAECLSFLTAVFWTFRAGKAAKRHKKNFGQAGGIRYWIDRQIAAERPPAARKRKSGD